MAVDTVVHKYGGQVLATGVTFEEYLERFAGLHCELVDGNVIKESPVSLHHQDLKVHLLFLLKMYIDMKPLGIVILQPFVQHLTQIDSNREPDLLFVLNENKSYLKDNYLDGAADICIEITSPGTDAIDRGKKFIEYEKGGVHEYWLIDPRRFDALFYRLNADGLYESQLVDVKGNYRTPLLPGFTLHVPTLWQTPLPDLAFILTAIQDMLK
jgi:Uma2 family endonuclease